MHLKERDHFLVMGSIMCLIL
ncbi:hypothetical protein LINPERPRIM_LOCUS24373 [Linum perenne]